MCSASGTSLVEPRPGGLGWLSRPSQQPAGVGRVFSEHPGFVGEPGVKLIVVEGARGSVEEHDRVPRGADRALAIASGSGALACPISRSVGTGSFRLERGDNVSRPITLGSGHRRVCWCRAPLWKNLTGWKPETMNVGPRQPVGRLGGVESEAYGGLGRPVEVYGGLWRPLPLPCLAGEAQTVGLPMEAVFPLTPWGEGCRLNCGCPDFGNQDPLGPSVCRPVEAVIPPA